MHTSWVLIVITVIVTDCFCFTTDHREVVCPPLVGDFRKNNLQAATVHTCLCCLSTQGRMHSVRMCPCGLTHVVVLRTCLSVTDCTHLYCLLPCVRVRCRLYPHGLTVLLTVLLFWFAPLCESSLWTVSTWAYCLLFWFAPLCESPLRTVSTWAYCFTPLVCSLVWEPVADCIHMGLLFYSFGFLPCLRVHCRLYPHEECGILSSCVRVCCRMIHMWSLFVLPLCELVVRCTYYLGTFNFITVFLERQVWRYASLKHWHDSTWY